MVRNCTAEHESSHIDKLKRVFIAEGDLDFFESEQTVVVVDFLTDLVISGTGIVLRLISESS